MSLYPVERYPMPAQKGLETHPKVRILYFCIPLAHPVGKPSLIDGIDNIRRVTIYMHLRIMPLYGLKPLYHCKKLHAVICRKAEPLRHLHFPSGATQHHSIASRSGISARGAICIKEYRRSLLIVFSHAPYSMILPPLGLISVSGIFMVMRPSTKAALSARLL